jgi:uncharacterized protein
LVDRLADAGVQAIGLDLVFSETETPPDASALYLARRILVEAAPTDPTAAKEIAALDRALSRVDTDARLALSGRVDVLFLGMGDQIAHPPRDLVEALEQAGVMVEAMASPTAARTYNVTLGEGRRVACALLPI